MRKILPLLALVFAAASFNACTECKPLEKEDTSSWGKPLQVTVYSGTDSSEVSEQTNYSYDTEGRLTGYKRTNSFRGVREEMYDSRYSGNVHSYKVDSYEWIGADLPVVFSHTDTYSDDTFAVLTESVVEGIVNEQGMRLDYKRTTTYQYEDGRLKGYHTEANRYGPWTTHVEYRTGIPSESDLQKDSSEENTYYDVIYTDGTGNRTGYYSGVNSRIKNWSFKYGNGYCTYYTGTTGNPQASLVRVVFYPEIF